MIQDRYRIVYPKHDYPLARVTDKHKEWCKEGLCVICDLETGKDMVLGQWSK